MAACHAGSASQSWRTTIAAGALAFGGAALLLTWSAGSAKESGPTREALTVVPSGVRLRVIAIDGFDARIFDELAASGVLPALTATVQGTRARLESRQGDAGDPARVWTTIATGQPPDVHGVQGLETRRVAGMQGSVAIAGPSPLGRAIRGATDLVRLTRPAIASGSERRAKTFWEVAAEAGLRTAVVNWWATWPASAGHGHRAERPRHAAARTRRPARCGDRAGEPLRAAAPALAGNQGGARRPAPPARSRTPATIRRTHSCAAPPSSTRSSSGFSRRSPRPEPICRWSTCRASTSRSTRCSGLTRLGLAASTLAARLDAVKAYYSMLDRLLAPFLTPAADELVILVTEPGRVGENGAARLSARGAGVRPHDASSSAATAVAPTVLYALGIPLGRDLPSAPLLELFDPQFTARYPVRQVATYGRPSTAPPSRIGTAARSGDDRSVEEPGVREVSWGQEPSPLRTPSAQRNIVWLSDLGGLSGERLLAPGGQLRERPVNVQTVGSTVAARRILRMSTPMNG